MLAVLALCVADGRRGTYGEEGGGWLVAVDLVCHIAFGVRHMISDRMLATAVTPSICCIQTVPDVGLMMSHLLLCLGDSACGDGGTKRG